ncbi:MAG TPA: hypothetical protein VFZ89_00070 [Solirubrobacteraceae bacterium]
MRGAVIVGITCVALGALAQPARAQTTGCASLSPLALSCVALQKAADALAKRDTAAAREAYLRSWTHRAAQLQYALQDDLPLTRAQWIGTHNSFNSVDESPTLSNYDSNQQLSLRQQLDLDVRALELDLHVVNGRVIVCHGRGAEELNLGCTTEPALPAVLGTITAWLDAHRDQVILLYLEDDMDSAAGYAQAVAQLDEGLGQRLYRPAPSGAAACTPLPLRLSRNAVRRTGAQVVLVGNCRRGWAPVVFGWDAEHVEGGSAAAYKPYPACDATYGRDVYGDKLVRYFEDSTLLRVLTAPTTPATDPARLTPATTAAMTACGVNLFGFDQLLPDDGRLAATIWSWAPDEPRADGGACTIQRSDGRWARRPCTARRIAACRRGSTWLLTGRALTFDAARKRCRRRHAPLGVPRSGDENARLRALAGATEVWINRRASRAAS